MEIFETKFEETEFEYESFRMHIHSYEFDEHHDMMKRNYSNYELIFQTQSDSYIILTYKIYK